MSNKIKQSEKEKKDYWKSRMNDKLEQAYQAALPYLQEVSRMAQVQGIDKEDLKTIFDRFYRSDSNKNIKGHGLGLAIANSIIKAHNGKIEVLSTKAIGTTFIVTLPISS